MQRKSYQGLLVVFTLLTLLGMLTIYSATAQPYEWVEQFGTPSSDEIVDLVMAPDGSVYAVGVTGGALPSQTSYGGNDAFVTKYDSSGNTLWTRQFGAANTDAATAVGLSADGYVYVAGITRFMFSTIADNHSYDIFLAKYDTFGNHIWSVGYDTSVFYDKSWYSFSDQVSGLDIDNEGNIYLAGMVREAHVNMNPSIAGDQDLLLLKYDMDGNQLWVHQYTGPSSEGASSLEVDSGGSVYVVGDGDGKALLQKYDASGALLWSKYYGGSGNSIGFDIDLRENDGIYFVVRQAGSYGGLTSYGYNDIVLVKTDFEGNEVWARQFGTALSDSPYGLLVDTSDGILVTGGVPGALPNQTHFGSTDIFISRFDTLGNNAWHLQLGGVDWETASAIGIAPDNTIIVGGAVNGVFPGGSAHGGTDALIVKVAQPSLNSPPTADAGDDYVGFEGDIVSLSGEESSDPDGIEDIVSFEWTFGDGHVGTGNRVDHVYDDNGIYEVVLTVTDIAGETDTDEIVVFVNNAVPTAAFSTGSGREGSSIPLELNNVYDPSALDTLAGFSFAFDCGDGFVDTLNPHHSCTFDEQGSYFVRGRVADKDGGFSEYETIIEVASVAPIATLSASPATIDEGSTTKLSFNNQYDPSLADTAAGFIYAFDCESNDIYEVKNSLVDNYDCAFPEDGLYQASGTISDKDASESVYSIFIDVRNVAPVVGTISVYSSPMAVNTLVEASASFTDAGVLDTHTAIWNWGDDTTSVGAISEADEVGTVSGSHNYAEPGVYALTMKVTDDDGDSDIATYEYVVIYDPEGGFVTGGGWIDSEVGWCQMDAGCAGAEGKANFGFVSKYKKGAQVPTGNTQFNFKAGDFNFHSSDYDWLVVNQNGTNAQYKGSGTINGEGNYKFMLWAGDGETDTFRIKIWHENGGEVVVYDNGLEQSIGGGNIVVHTGK